jgi:hypothetical protein
MPVGMCQANFGVMAKVDGLMLSKVSIAGLTDAGHLALPADSASRAVLAEIFRLLGGDEADLRAGIHLPLPHDWIAEGARLIIEVDESQHFTSDRLLTLQNYPADVGVTFSVSEYIGFCEALAAGSDRYRSAKPARGFRRPGGRRAQRAYFDAVRDLGAPVFGWRVFRVPAGHGDGKRAYLDVRQSLRALL